MALVGSRRSPLSYGTVGFPKDAVEGWSAARYQIAAVIGHSSRAVHAILDRITSTDTRRLLRASSASSKRGQNSQLLRRAQWVSGKPREVMVGAQGLEPWTR